MLYFYKGRNFPFCTLQRVRAAYSPQRGKMSLLRFWWKNKDGRIKGQMLRKTNSKATKVKVHTRLPRKYVMTELNFFHVQFEVPRVKSRQYSKKNSVEGSQF